MSVPMTELLEMGAKLKDPPEALSQRINLLDAIEGLLSRVDQAPPFPVCHVLLPIKEGLISPSFFGSPDVRVKVTSLSCIHELMRISVPDAPYEDDRMKEIFNETVKAFEHLPSRSGRCFQKAKTMLDSVANVRSGLLMLDLGCTPLVAQMFQIFLRDLRSDYPFEVLSDMENLMTQLVMEADELSVDFLRPLVMSVGAENQASSPPSAVLAMKVLQNCSDIVQPFLQTVIQQMRRDLDAYSYAASSLLPKENVLMAQHGSRTARYGSALPSSSVSGAQQIGQGSALQGPSVSGAQQIGQGSALPGPSVSSAQQIGQGSALPGPSVSGAQQIGQGSGLPGPSVIYAQQIGQGSALPGPSGAQQIGQGSSLPGPSRRKRSRPRKFVLSEDPRREVVHADGHAESLRLSQEPQSLVHGTSTIQEGNQELNPPGASSSYVPVTEVANENTRLGDGASTSTQRYYEGTVSSHDPSRKKHRVVHADGHVESLRLSQEPRSLVRGRSTIQEGNQEPNPPNASSYDHVSNPPDASSSDVPVDETENENARLGDGASTSTQRPNRRVQSGNVIFID